MDLISKQNIIKAKYKGGRPKGRLGDKTLERKLEIEYIRKRVEKAKDVLIDSQLSLAQGVSYLYRIDSEKDAKGNKHNKKPELVTSRIEIESYLAGEYDHEEDIYYYITTAKPENNAIDSLFDRAIGKPKNVTEITGKDGADLFIPDERIKALAEQLNENKRD